MILTTHYMEEAENLCDYIIIMDHGLILREGTLNQLLDEDSNYKVVEFITENANIPEDLPVRDLPFEIRREPTGNKGYATLKNFETDLPLLLNYLKSENISLRNMECRRKTLDDLFVSLTGRNIDE